MLYIVFVFESSFECQIINPTIMSLQMDIEMGEKFVLKEIGGQKVQFLHTFTLNCNRSYFTSEI